MNLRTPCLALAATLLLPGAAPAAERPLFAFDNGLPDVPGLEQKAALLKQLGYAGIGWRPGRTAEMLAALDRHGLKMFATYVVLNATATDCPLPAATVAEIDALAGRDTIVWLGIAGTSTDAVVVPAIRRVADAAARNRLQVAIYPHVGFHSDTVAAALRLATLADRPNVGVSFNLCHFLKQQDEAELEATLRAAAPRLLLASLNGADAGDTRAMDWNRLIQPLGAGSFDAARLLKLFDEIGYQGPVGLQCYQLKPPARDHLGASITAWRTLQPH